MAAYCDKINDGSLCVILIFFLFFLKDFLEIKTKLLRANDSNTSFFFFKKKVKSRGL